MRKDHIPFNAPGTIIYLIVNEMVNQLTANIYSRFHTTFQDTADLLEIFSSVLKRTKSYKFIWRKFIRCDSAKYSALKNMENGQHNQEDCFEMIIDNQWDGCQSLHQDKKVG